MPQTGELLWYIVGVTVVGLGAMLIGILAARAFKKGLRAEVRSEAFTIQQIREMRERGEITQKEYETMRAAVIGQTTADSSTPARENLDPQPAGGLDVEDDTEGTAPDAAPDDGR
jgi:hypothetical protein